MIYKNKVVLITGGTGTLGTALSKHILKSNPKKLIIFSRCWLKQKELRRRLGDPPNVRWFIGDVRDKDRLIRALHGVDIVVHAAAVKDIDACRYNPSEALATNVTGTQNVAEACISNQVPKALFISSDKAVAPCNFYGTSKAMAEELWLAYNNYAATDDISFSVCRYGNVVGSNGSIVPVYQSLIDDGAKSLPVTDERMTRYWFEMSAVLPFVDDSIKSMKGGEIFIPELPSVLITDICKAFDMPYHIIGIREGEKIAESMGQGTDSGNNPNGFLTVEEIRQTIARCIK
jgi:UDP-N-acetylglucosamine 4,6-dehydratase